MLPNKLAVSSLKNSAIASNISSNELDSIDSINGGDDLNPSKGDR